MSPRTSWDPPTATGGAVEDYRRRRRRRIARQDGDVRAPEELETGRLEEGKERGLTERARQQDYRFERGHEMKRDAALRRHRRRGQATSGETKFTTDDAAEALANRKKRTKAGRY